MLTLFECILINVMKYELFHIKNDDFHILFHLPCNMFNLIVCSSWHLLQSIFLNFNIFSIQTVFRYVLLQTI